MQITIYTDLTGFETLADEWDDLLKRSIHPPFFMQYVYQYTWWRYLGNNDLILMAIRTAEDKLVGLVPLYATTNAEKQGQLSFVGCVDVSDYLDLLIDKDYVDPVYRSVLDCLASDSLAWDKLYLCSLPHNSITHTRFAAAAQQRGWRVELKEQDVCPVITLPDTWDDYLASINKKQRHEIRRKMRKIENEVETRWYVVDSQNGLDGAMDDFIALHQKSTGDKQDFWSDKRVAFFKALATELVKQGAFRLYFIELNGVKAAAMLGFDYNNEFLLYNSGYDPTLFANLSPGNVLTSYTIQDAINLGRKRYDFLRGDEVYKFRFGGVAEVVYDLEIYR